MAVVVTVTVVVTDGELLTEELAVPLSVLLAEPLPLGEDVGTVTEAEAVLEGEVLPEGETLPEGGLGVTLLDGVPVAEGDGVTLVVAARLPLAVVEVVTDGLTLADSVWDGELVRLALGEAEGELLLVKLTLTLALGVALGEVVGEGVRLALTLGVRVTEAVTDQLTVREEVVVALELEVALDETEELFVCDDVVDQETEEDCVCDGVVDHVSVRDAVTLPLTETLGETVMTAV